MHIIECPERAGGEHRTMSGNIGHGHNSPGHQSTGHPWDGLENPQSGKAGAWGYDYYDGYGHVALTPQEKDVLVDRQDVDFTGQY